MNSADVPPYGRDQISVEEIFQWFHVYDLVGLPRSPARIAVCPIYQHPTHWRPSKWTHGTTTEEAVAPGTVVCDADVGRIRKAHMNRLLLTLAEIRGTQHLKRRKIPVITIDSNPSFHPQAEDAMIRTSLFLLPVLTLFLAPPVAAQDNGDRQGVRQAVLDYVEGFYEGDTTRLVRSVWPEVRKYGYWQSEPNGAYAGQPMPYDEFMSFANGVRSGENRTPANAPKEIEIYDVMDQTASAKLTAWWGTDYLLLAREQGRWMIVAVVWQGPLRQ